MPTIHAFDRGALKICMYADDHAPPHFHLVRSDNQCIVALPSLEVMAGNISRRDYVRAVQWAAANLDLLETKWTELNERD